MAISSPPSSSFPLFFTLSKQPETSLAFFMGWISVEKGNKQLVSLSNEVRIIASFTSVFMVLSFRCWGRIFLANFRKGIVEIIAHNKIFKKEVWVKWNVLTCLTCWKRASLRYFLWYNDFNFIELVFFSCSGGRRKLNKDSLPSRFLRRYRISCIEHKKFHRM